MLKIKLLFKTDIYNFKTFHSLTLWDTNSLNQFTKSSINSRYQSEDLGDGCILMEQNGNKMS